MRLLSRPLATRRRDDEGVAMVTVVILIVVCFTVASVIAASTMFGVRQTSSDQSRLQALAAAEGGRDYTVSQLTNGCTSSTYSSATTPAFTTTIYPSGGASAPTSTSGLTAGCPGASAKWVVVRSIGKAPDGTLKEVDADYPWSASAQQAIADGAIIEGGSAPDNISSAQVYHGDMILNTTGTVDCNGSATFDGDVVLPRGSISLSNSCKITGSVIAYGDIKLYNMTTAVGGDIISTHGNVSIEGATVNGNVKAYGGVSLNNSVTIGHDVVAEGQPTATNSTGTSSFTGSSGSMKTIGGSVTVGGPFSQLDLAQITGSVSVASTGVSKIGSVGSVTASSIKLAGTCSTCTATPTPTQNVKGLVAPTFPDPPQMGYPTWVDYPYRPADWSASGYHVVAANQVLSGDTGCNYQGDTALINAVDALTSDTVIDATACVDKKGASSFNLYGVALNLKASVTFIAAGYSAQTLTVNSADGANHYFNLITPDATADGAPTCTGSASTVTAAVLGAHISGMAYTPCTLSWGSAGSTNTQWAGQLVAGFPDFSGSGGAVDFSLIPLPGNQTSAGLVATGPVKGAMTPTLVSQTEP